jgi:hypothetical protein
MSISEKAVDTNSLTWQVIEKFIESERQVALDCLVEDFKCEQQRGALLVLGKLASLGKSED